MNRHPIKYFTLGTILAVNISVFFCTFFMQEKSVQGQHAGGGIIDTTKQPGKEAPSYHQSFVPYEGTIQVPWIDEKHQVDCYFFKVIKQTQVRTVENLSCKRERDGTQYWLSDGKKYVEWGKWSIWNLEKEDKNIEMAEKKP